MQQLPKDVCRNAARRCRALAQLDEDVLPHIYSYDATYHEIYRSVLHELVVNLELKELFERDIIFVVHHPRCLRAYDKKDFECFARYLGILTSRKSAEAPPRIFVPSGHGTLRVQHRSKITRKRLIAKLCCYYLQKGKMWYLPIGSKGMWVFS